MGYVLFCIYVVNDPALFTNDNAGKRGQGNILEHLRSIWNTVEGPGMALYVFGDSVYMIGILRQKDSKWNFHPGIDVEHSRVFFSIDIQSFCVTFGILDYYGSFTHIILTSRCLVKYANINP